MQLETLYKRTKTGAIQYWSISTEPMDVFSTIVKESGQLGTNNPIIHTETIEEGKNIGKSNETSPIQQADLQAQSDWRKKKDEGYKSLSDLMGIENAYTDETETPGLLEKLLNSLLPKFNTDASGNVKPMLAMDWKKVKSIPYPVYIQPKLDGVRCLMIVANDDVTFLSRSGKEYTTLDHIRLDVIQFITRYENSTPELQSFILDGEIYSDELSFQQITAAVKKQREGSLKLHFRAYDVVSEGDHTQRLATVSDIVNSIMSPYIHEVPTAEVHNELQVQVKHNEFVQAGYEGAMLRLPEGKYEQGARSRSLLKVKEFDEAEFPFLRWELGQREEDLIAVLLNEDGAEFRAKMMGNRKEKEVMYQLGITPKELTVKYFGLTDDGIPRFPIGKAIRDYE